MNKFLFHWRHCKRILRDLAVTQRVVVGLLSAYYSLTLLSALLEGVGIVLLVTLFTSGGELKEKDAPEYIFSLIRAISDGAQLKDLLLVLIGIYGVNLALRLGLLSFEGLLAANLRRRIQENIFRRYLFGDWASMRNLSVGEAVGSNTQEAVIVARYLVCTVSTGYFLLSALVLAVLAAYTSLQIFIAFVVVALPVVLFMRLIIEKQSKYSRRFAELRNRFAADITDRFNGLLQIHTDVDPSFHLRKGIRLQPQLTHSEELIGYCQAIIGSFTVLLPFAALLTIALWLGFGGSNEPPDMALAASIGVLGIRFSSQMNGAVASVGNLSRLSGSLYPVIAALEITSARSTAHVPETVSAVRLYSVAYAYGEAEVLRDVTLNIDSGAPVVLVGPSGGGKSTLANLISGLCVPSRGAVVYVGKDSRHEYPSTLYRARVGYVTQDIYLFKGSLRDNLVSGQAVADETIWHVLEQVGASEFVHALGGLDAESLEAGRSLSGGQRRRLGIARALLSASDILIFDEITAGLDQINRQAVLELVALLAETHVMVLISHEEISFPGQQIYAIRPV